MLRALCAVLASLAVILSCHGIAFAGDETIVGIWEREIEKGELEETWVIKKIKDKWSVSGSIYNLGKEVGSFKGKDVKYADDTLTFTQDYFKLPKGRIDGAKVTASADEDRLNIIVKEKSAESKDTMKRAGDASELIGKWTTQNTGMTEFWTIEKDKKGALTVRGIYMKDNQEVGRWKAVNVRYFMQGLTFNQQFDLMPVRGWVNGVFIGGVVRGDRFPFMWYNGSAKGKAELTRVVDAK